MYMSVYIYIDIYRRRNLATHGAPADGETNNYILDAAQASEVAKSYVCTAFRHTFSSATRACNSSTEPASRQASLKTSVPQVNFGLPLRLFA